MHTVPQRGGFNAQLERGGRVIERFRGCLLGHALGDALGAPVEFRSRSEILRAYGPDGIRAPEPWGGHPAGSYTDDTQLTLATAEALLDAAAAWHAGAGDETNEALYARYLEWYATQSDPAHRRGPGNTCLAALGSGTAGDTFDPINDSKGAGGIMRVSPIGLVYEPDRAFEVAVDAAAITHGHPTGYLAAGFYADVISRVIRGQGLSSAIAATRELLTGYDDAEETLSAVDLAVELFMGDVHPIEAIGRIGEGWIAEEALAIALHCALSYPADWVEGTLAAVNITGDSDTTGCLAGALLGAVLGEVALPAHWVEGLEGSERIGGTAERLAGIARQSGETY